MQRSILLETSRLLAAGEVGAAARCLEAHLARAPGDSAVLRALGRVRLRQGKVAEAAVLMRRSFHYQDGLSDELEESLLEEAATAQADGSPGLGLRDDEGVAFVEKEASDIGARRSRVDWSGRDSANSRPSQSATESLSQRHRQQDAVAAVDFGGRGLPLPGFEMETGILLDDSDDSDSEDAELYDFDMASDSDWSEVEPTSLARPDDFDWELVDPAAAEFDEQPTREELQQEVVTAGGLTDRERALQMALTLGARWSWHAAEIKVLWRILELSPWAATCRALDRSIAAGATADELNLACDLRQIWAGCEHYAANLHGYSHFYLTWPLALKTIRAFRQEPDLEEVDRFLAEAFEAWHSDLERQDEYSSFRDYLNELVTADGLDKLASPEVAVWLEIEQWDDGFDGGRYEGFNTPRRQALEEWGFTVEAPPLPV